MPQEIREEDDEDGDGDDSKTEPNTPSDSDDNMLGTPRITRKVPLPDTPAKSMFKKAKDAKDATRRRTELGRESDKFRDMT